MAGSGRAAAKELRKVGVDDAPLPDGVELESLAGARADVSALYAAAFAEDGAAAAALAAPMQAVVEEVEARGQSTHQDPAWQAYGFADFVAQTTQGALREFGEAQLTALCAGLGPPLGGKPLPNRCQ